MGAQPTTVSFHDVPNATLIFGPTKDDSLALKKLRSTISTIDDVVSSLDNAVQAGSPYINFLTTVGTYTPYVSLFFTFINKLIADSEVLNKALNDLEQNIYSTFLDGKLSALKNHLATMQSNQTSLEQKRMELVSAISHFHEILPIFTRNDPILYRKYYIGAQLFVPFCGLFKLINVIASNTPTYNNPELERLKRNYQNTLQSFKHRCVRERLKSIYMQWFHFDDEAAAFTALYFMDDLLQLSAYVRSTSREEFELNQDSRGYSDIKYNRGASVARAIFWEYHSWNRGRIFFFFRRGLFSRLEDPWDYREQKDISYNTMTLNTNGRRDPKRDLFKKVVREYRANVFKVMEEFFDPVMP